MITIPLQPSERWDAPQSVLSRPDADLNHLSAACGGAQFKRLVMSPTVLRTLTIHPWFREEYLGIWVCGQGMIQMIPAPTLESIERVLGASLIGPILPGSLEIDASAGADVMAEWDGGRARGYIPDMTGAGYDVARERAADVSALLALMRRLVEPFSDGKPPMFDHLCQWCAYGDEKVEHDADCLWLICQGVRDGQ